MPKTSLPILLLSGLLAAATAAASPITVTFDSVNGANAFGYYVGPYYGHLESQNVSLFCDDFANEVTFGQKWMANLSSITVGSDLSNTRYGDVKDSLRLYQQIAWLDLQFGRQPTDQWGDIHATIWQIFDAAEAPKPSSPYWLNQAEKNYQDVNYENFRVVTNIGPVEKTGQVQEFLTMLAPGSPSGTSTPEPATAVLIGSALLAAAWVTRRRMAK